jgi:O-acetyl-ADP-ribose deacetylase (regulator of RNase III)
VIHAVGPIYNNGVSGEAQLLANAYRNSLVLAVENNVRSIAFPSAFDRAHIGYPVRERRADRVEHSRRISENTHASTASGALLFDSKTYETYGTILRRIQSSEAEG